MPVNSIPFQSFRKRQLVKKILNNPILEPKKLPTFENKAMSYPQSHRPECPIERKDTILYNRKTEED